LFNTSYNLLNIKIAATTTAITPITAIPATLINNIGTAAM
jgi:hypothetical protein